MTKPSDAVFKVFFLTKHRSDRTRSSPGAVIGLVVGFLYTTYLEQLGALVSVDRSLSSSPLGYSLPAPIAPFFVRHRQKFNHRCAPAAKVCWRLGEIHDVGEARQEGLHARALYTDAATVEQAYAE